MARRLSTPIAVLMLLFTSLAAPSIAASPPKARTTAQTYRVGGDIVAPVAFSHPQLATLEGATPGIVIFEAVINTEGRVEEVRVLRSTSKGSANAVVKAVRQWRFKPAMLHGKPVQVYLTMVVHLCA